MEVRRSEDGLTFAAPPLLRYGAPSEAELTRAAEVLRIHRTMIVDARWADNGPGWLVILLASAEAVLELQPVRYHPERIDLGVVGPHSGASDADYELRAFFSGPMES